MAWQCGIDEAGYGPNLGPFVMSLVALQVPDALAIADLWSHWAAHVRKAKDTRDDRIIVDDSKAVYSTASGIRSLEANLRYFLPPHTNLKELWDAVVLTPPAERDEEPWYADPLPLPVASTRTDWISERPPEITLLSPAHLRAVVLLPRTFNRLVRKGDSKAAVPLWSVGKLLEELASLPGEAVQKLYLALDRLGGRQKYAGVLSELCFGSRIDVTEESAARGKYRVHFQRSVCEMLVEPKADQNHFAVALASMLSKYLRELLMHQFNVWWCSQQPGLAPTAGYPVDARRWWEDTAITRSKLNVDDGVLWRER